MAKAKVMVVEDELILAKGIEFLLRRNGYEVCGPVTTGEEALIVAKERRPDVALLDIALAGPMDGVAAADHLRREMNIPAIFLTAYGDRGTVERACAAEPYSYLLKPFDDTELLIAVEVVLAKDKVQREMNQRLEHKRALLQAIFESMPCGLMAVDKEGTIRAANAFLGRLMGIKAEEVLGRPMSAIFGCAAARQGTKACDGETCTNWCVFRRCAEEAFLHKSSGRVEVEHDVTAGGRTSTLRLSVTAATGQLEGETLAFLLVEDRTEIDTLRRVLRTEVSFAGIVAKDGKMRDLFETIQEVADGTVPVLIQGESGTGKELVAMAIHSQGPRADKRFVAVNCGALPDGLLESELFGHERGAFTGAVRDKKGRFELADGGTLFLDEVGELSPAMQVKLLRVLQTGAFERVGGEKTVQVDVRLISATNRNVEKDVAEGRFRSDLFYRLCVVPVTVPPLRERRGDIPLLVDHILERIAKTHGRAALRISPEAMLPLLDHAWPGNVRELENVLQYAFIKSKGATIQPQHLPASLVQEAAAELLRAPRRPVLTAIRVAEALRTTAGNRVQAARHLGISRATLYRFLSEGAEAGPVRDPSDP